MIDGFVAACRRASVMVIVLVAVVGFDRATAQRIDHSNCASISLAASGNLIKPIDDPYLAATVFN